MVAMENLTKLLEMRRLERRMSQSELAAILGVTQGHYSKISSGKLKLSRKLRASAEQWLGSFSPDYSDSDSVRLKQLLGIIDASCAEAMHILNTD